MKKILAGVCIVSMCIMGACASDKVEENEQNEQQEVVSQESNISLNCAKTEIYTVSDDSGKQLMYIEQYKPIISGVNAEVSAKINGYLTQEFEDFKADALTNEEDAKIVVPQVQHGGCYSFEQNIMDMQVYNNKVVVIYDNYANLLGAHPSRFKEALSFSLDTGELLSIGDMLGDSDFKMDVLTDLVNEHLLNEGVYDKDMLFEDYEQSLANIKDNTLYVDEKGIHVIYNEYEIAPYATGCIEVVVPLQEYHNAINDDWADLVKVEQNSNGEVFAQYSDDTKGIVINTGVDGEFKIYTDGNLYNASLYRVSGFNDNESFYKSHLIYKAQVLSKDEPWLINDFLSEGVPNLMFSFEKDGEIKNYLVSESGKDGSIIFMDDFVLGE